MPENPTVRELDHRFSDGIDVRLLWRPHDDRVLVAVADAKTGVSFTLEVGPDQRALEVFHHPRLCRRAPQRRREHGRARPGERIMTRVLRRFRRAVRRRVEPAIEIAIAFA